MNKQENYNFFIKTIKLLAQSQGLYGRLLADIQEMDEQQKQEFMEQLPDFENDTLNVVFYVEQ